jgi:hypothetical protein
MTPLHWTILSAAAGLAAAGVTAWRPLVPGRRWPLWLVAVAAVAFVVHLALGWWHGVPEPRVHDEFSYLLAADTFAHGRLANPTPPAWPALQSFHVLMVPAYASKYPPGQGLTLALGQLATGMPIVGAWMAAAVLAATGGWAVAGLLRPAWGIGAAVLLALHPQAVEWAQTYWGGTLSAIGGALVLGGWARASTADGRAAGVAVGLGLGVLLNTRPYEGMAAAAPFVVHLLLRRRRAALVAAVALLPVLILTGFYDARVTGRAWQLPYAAYEQQYAAAPPLLVQSPRPVPPGVPASMRDYAVAVELPHYAAQRTVRGFLTSVAGKLAMLGRATLPSPWLWPLAVAIPWAVAADRRLSVVAMSLVTTVAATLLSNWTRTQYVAPATVMAAVLLAAAAARLPAWIGRPLWAAAVVGTGMLAFAPAVPGPRFQRSQLAASLDREPGRQLVLVTYGPDHRPDDEWVYNDADPAAAKVVWARADVLSEADVRAAYPGRTVWHLDVTASAATVHRDETR